MCRAKGNEELANGISVEITLALLYLQVLSVCANVNMYNTEKIIYERLVQK